MTVYQSSIISGRESVISSVEGSNDVLTLVTSVAVPSTLSTSDSVELFYLPKNAIVIGGFLKSTDLDTNVSPTVTINVGDSGSAGRFFSASTVGQAGGVTTTLATGGVAYQTTAKKTLVKLSLGANAATPAAGTVTVGLNFVIAE